MLTMINKCSLVINRNNIYSTDIGIQKNNMVETSINRTRLVLSYIKVYKNQDRQKMKYQSVQNQVKPLRLREQGAETHSLKVPKEQTTK